MNFLIKIIKEKPFVDIPSNYTLCPFPFYPTVKSRPAYFHAYIAVELKKKIWLQYSKSIKNPPPSYPALLLTSKYVRTLSLFGTYSLRFTRTLDYLPLQARSLHLCSRKKKKKKKRNANHPLIVTGTTV